MNLKPCQVEKMSLAMPKNYLGNIEETSAIARYEHGTPPLI
jgi:hypothetical protein